MSNLAIGQAGGTAQRMLTTPASQTGAAYIAPAGPSVWGPPRPPRIVQPFIKEEIPLLKQTSGFDAGMRIRWDMTRDADFVHTLTLRVVLPAIPPARYQGGATYARYVDLPGLACWSQIVVRMGSIVLHTIRPEELLLQAQHYMHETARRNWYRMVGQGTLSSALFDLRNTKYRLTYQSNVIGEAFV